MSVDLEDKLAAMGIMNAPAYAKKFAEDEWTWEALVGCSDETVSYTHLTLPTTEAV